MARLHVRKKNKAGKKITCSACGATIKAGETYFFWTNRIGRASMKRIRCHKHRPRPSDMTMSEHRGMALRTQEMIEDACADARTSHSADDLINTLDSAYSDIESHIEEIEEKISNLEQSFPNGCPSLSTLEEYRDGFEEFKTNIETAKDEIESKWDDKSADLDVDALEESYHCDDITEPISDISELDLGDAVDVDAIITELEAAREEKLDELVESCCEEAEGIDCPI